MSLTPADPTQCQAETLEGSFMTIGPRSMVRCKNTPKFIVTENKPGKDGLVGSMSLCSECAEEFSKQYPKDFATFKPIIAEKK